MDPVVKSELQSAVEARKELGEEMEPAVIDAFGVPALCTRRSFWVFTGISLPVGMRIITYPEASGPVTISASVAPRPLVYSTRSPTRALSCALAPGASTSCPAPIASTVSSILFAAAIVHLQEGCPTPTA